MSPSCSRVMALWWPNSGKKNAKQDGAKLNCTNMRPESHFVLSNLLRMMALKDFCEHQNVMAWPFQL